MFVGVSISAYKIFVDDLRGVTVTMPTCAGVAGSILAWSEYKFNICLMSGRFLGMYIFTNKKYISSIPVV